MERLEPILKQKFWILLGIGTLMTVAGWWMATGSMAATITTRRDEIGRAEGKIPSGEIPSDKWSVSLAAKNADQDRAVRLAARGLWERQRDRMVWPDTVAEFAWKNGYRGEIALEGRENYRTAYGYDVRRVWESVRPFNRFDGTGIVDFGPDERSLSQRSWGTLAPSSAEMWDSQEDLWLQESILQSIVTVNGGAKGERLDASIHAILEFKLCGGQPAAQRKSQTAAAGGSDAMGVGDFGGGGGGGRQQSIASADFDWKEEFGDDGSGAGAGGGGAGPGLAMGSGPGQSGAGGPDAGGARGATASRIRRYIDDEEALPFKTRGFYLSVVMDHRKIPELIAELTSNEKSAWPVEVMRVQFIRSHDDDIEGRGVGGGGIPRPGPPAGGGAPAAGATSQQAEAAAVALENAMQDPYMAHVAICGIITLYKEVKAEEVVPATAVPANPAAGQVPAVTPAPGVGIPPATNTPPATQGQPQIPGTNVGPGNESAPAKSPTDGTTPATESSPAVEAGGGNTSTPAEKPIESKAPPSGNN